MKIDGGELEIPLSSQRDMIMWLEGALRRQRRLARCRRRTYDLRRHLHLVRLLRAVSVKK